MGGIIINMAGTFSQYIYIYIQYMTKNICLNGWIKMSPLRGFIGGDVTRMGDN
jgi:hypothetical protein